MKIKTLKSLRSILNPKKNTLSILDCFYIDKEFLFFSDLHTFIRIRHHFPVKEDSAPMVIDSSFFVSRMQSIKPPFIISINDAGKAVFTTAESSSTLPGTPNGEYPLDHIMKEDKGIFLFDLLASDVQKLHIASDFVCVDELRPVMQMVCYSRDNIASSDAHMLYYAKIKEVYDKDVLFSKNVIRLMMLFPGLNYQISRQAKNLVAGSQDVTIWWRDDEMNYPNFRSVIGKWEKKITLPLKATIDALTAVEFAANQASYQAIFKMKGEKIIISATDIDFELSASETVNIINPEKYEMEFGFKLPFIKKVLKVLLDEGYYQAEVRFEDPTKNFVFQDKLLLMPMMINS